MYNQTFSGIALFSLVRKNEREILDSLFRTEDSIIEKLDNECKKLNSQGFYFSFTKSSDVFLNGFKKNSFEYVFQELVLRKMHLNIRKIYSIRYANRNQIIKQVLVLLKDTYPIFIGRFDVKSFYESIDRSKVVLSIEKDMRLSSVTLSLIKKVFNNGIISTSNGLPRGLGLSAALAELYLKPFDLEIKRISDVYYYARYVDDIIVFVSSKDACSELNSSVSYHLSRLSLSLNTTKTQILDESMLKRIPLDYLGYSFLLGGEIKDKSYIKGQYNEVDVLISEKKLKKNKTRLVKSFVAFTKSNDYSLLSQRIMYLTGNISFKGINTTRIIRSGIYYNYIFLSDKAILQLKELDKFYQKLLHCKTGKIGFYLNTNLSCRKLSQLEKYSFMGGYCHRIMHSFSLQDISRIKQIWN